MNVYTQKNCTKRLCELLIERGEDFMYFHELDREFEQFKWPVGSLGVVVRRDVNGLPAAVFIHPVGGGYVTMMPVDVFDKNGFVQSYDSPDEALEALF